MPLPVLEDNIYQPKLIDYSNYYFLSKNETVSGHLKIQDHFSHLIQDNMILVFKPN